MERGFRGEGRIRVPGRPGLGAWRGLCLQSLWEKSQRDPPAAENRLKEFKASSWEEAAAVTQACRAGSEHEVVPVEEGAGLSNFWRWSAAQPTDLMRARPWEEKPMAGIH